MPIYNGEAFLRQALDSLLAQTYTAWELIAVDDGSTDATPKVLEGYTDPRIRVIRQKNGGEAKARNRGLEHVRGEYMAFLDADDIYLPDALRLMVSFLDNHCQYAVVFSDGHIINEQGQHLMRLTEVRPGIFEGNILNPLVMSPSVITVPVCTMSRFEKIREYNLRFDEQNNLIGTDWDFWIRLAVHVQFGYLDEITCKYRIHTTNITRTTGSEKRKRDQTYRKLKILNSDWFCGLTHYTKELFFLEFLTETLTGDPEKQTQVLLHPQIFQVQAAKRAELWRMVGIDSLKTGSHSAQVRYFFEESVKLNPRDSKTRLMIVSLRVGRWLALILVHAWQLLLELRKKARLQGPSKSERLQMLLGHK
jgi:glycosyltransferase involved in cell wall biosynthesis